MVQYLFNAIEFPPGGSCPFTCTQNVKTVIYIRKNNTDHTTHKVESKTCRTINQNKKDNDNLNVLKRMKGRMT